MGRRARCGADPAGIRQELIHQRPRGHRDGLTRSTVQGLRLLRLQLKWHLGSGNGHRPLDHGFDYSFGFMNGCIDNYSHFFYWDGPNRHDLWENNQRVRLPGRYFPDLMVEEAKSFIAGHRTQPFFIYFAVNMPHYPYQGTEKWLRSYRNLPDPRRLYAAFVSTLAITFSLTRCFRPLIVCYGEAH